MEEILSLEAVDCGIIRQNFYTVLSGVCVDLPLRFRVRSTMD